MRGYALIFAAILVSSCQPAPTQPMNTLPQGEAAEVVRVLDGDSFIAEIDGRETEIRLIGVNAPEGDECHGDEARASLDGLLTSGVVTLDGDADDADQFGRTLRYVQVDGASVNLELLTRGDANVLQTDHRFDDEFVAAANGAATERIGLWARTACGSSGPIPDVFIADYVYNPPGRDDENPNGEWVAIANSAGTTVDLTGWLIRDESTRHRYRFPDRFLLASGEQVLVHSGCGTDTDSDLFWCADDPVWSNGGDTVILQLADGTVVDRELFTGDF